jgi:hypothetical protein
MYQVPAWSSGRPIGSQGTTNEMYSGSISNPIYDSDIMDWRSGLNNYSGMMNQQLAKNQAMVQRYAPGSSYGQGQRQTAQEGVQAGVAVDQAALAKSGMSGMAASSGLNTQAGSELTKLYANIEDTRNQLLTQTEQQASADYMNMMNMYTQFVASKPKYGSK